MKNKEDIRLINDVENISETIKELTAKLAAAELKRHKLVNDKKKRATCKNCKAVNLVDIYHNCWFCLEPLSEQIKGFYTMYKFGKFYYTPKTLEGIKDDYRKDPSAFLQPKKWDNVERKMVVNPDYVKKWGDPYAEGSGIPGKKVKERVDRK